MIYVRTKHQNLCSIFRLLVFFKHKFGCYMFHLHLEKASFWESFLWKLHMYLITSCQPKFLQFLLKCGCGSDNCTSFVWNWSVYEFLVPNSPDKRYNNGFFLSLLLINNMYIPISKVFLWVLKIVQLLFLNIYHLFGACMYIYYVWYPMISYILGLYQKAKLQFTFQYLKEMI